MANPTASAHLNGHAEDFQRIVRGLEVFVGLDFPELRAYYEVHEEDRLCDLPRADGKGIVPCTRDAIRALLDDKDLRSLVGRLCEFEVKRRGVSRRA